MVYILFQAADALFQMFEFYEAAFSLDLSHNEMIGSMGWQACSRMLRKVRFSKTITNSFA